MNGPCSLHAGPGPFYLIYGGGAEPLQRVFNIFGKGWEGSGGRMHETPGGLGPVLPVVGPAMKMSDRQDQDFVRSYLLECRTIQDGIRPEERPAPSEARVGDRRRLHPVRPADDDRRVLRRCPPLLLREGLRSRFLASTQVHGVSCKGPGAPYDCTDSQQRQTVERQFHRLASEWTELTAYRSNCAASPSSRLSRADRPRRGDHPTDTRRAGTQAQRGLVRSA